MAELAKAQEENKKTAAELAQAQDEGKKVVEDLAQARGETEELKRRTDKPKSSSRAPPKSLPPGSTPPWSKSLASTPSLI